MVNGDAGDDSDCSWDVGHNKMRLEDIVDLNSAEKTMMNLWNAHMKMY
jgi:hypothetical protein